MKFSTKCDLRGHAPSRNPIAKAANSWHFKKRGWYKPLITGLLLLLLSCVGNKGFATAWHTTATGAVNTLGNWSNGASAPTSFTTPGDTWQIQNSMTLATTWTVGTSGAAASTVTMISGGVIAVSLGNTGTANIFGNANFSGGSVTGGFASTVILNITGNASFSGTYAMTVGAIGGSTTVNFNMPTASGTMQIDNTSSGTFGATKFNVVSGCTAQLDANFGISGTGGLTVAGTLIIPATFVYDGSAPFVLSANGTLQVASVTGINGAITTTSGTKTFNAGANYVFNGTAAQVTGALMPATVNGTGSVTVSNPAGLTLSGNLTMNPATLAFTSGALALGGNTLGIGGILSGTSASNVITGGAGSALTIAGSGALSTIYFDQSAPGTSNLLTTFTMNRAGTTATLGNDLNTGTLALTSATGIIAGGANTISVSGNITGAGTVTNTGSGGVTMTGSGGTISAATLGNLTLNNAGGFGLTGSPTLTGSLNFTSGVITTGANTITMPGAAGNVTGAGASAYVNGTLRKTIAGVTSVNYEVGDANGYLPVLLAFDAAGTSGILAVQPVAGAQPQLITSNINSTQIVSDYWVITNTGAAGPTLITPTVTYGSGEIIGSGNTAFVGQEYASGAWSAILPATNTSSPSFTSTLNSGIALASAAGDYIFGVQQAPCVAPADGPSGPIGFPTITSVGAGGTVSFTNASSSPSGYIVVESTGALLGTPSATTPATAGTACCTNGTIIGTGTSGTPVTITSALSANTSYTISVFDYNNAGCIGGPVYNATTPVAATLLTCPAVSTLLLTGTATSSTLPISWTPPATGAATYTVNVYTSYTSPAVNVPAVGYTVTSTGANAATINGLDPFTTYYYTVTGNNTSCSSVASAPQTGTTLNAPCTGTPLGGIATASVIGVSGAATFTLGLSGASGSLGITYQWLSSTCGDSASFVAITGATNAAYTAGESAGTFYRCNVICSNTLLSALSVPVYVAYEGAICTTGFYTANGCTNNIRLSAFSLTGECGTSISETPPCTGSPYYTDRTAAVAPVNMFPGNVYSGSMTKTAAIATYAVIWIDFNDNGSFDDAGEKVFASTALPASPTAVAYSITIPSIAAGVLTYGMHRMRVRTSNTSMSATLACASLTAGIIDDYLVQIIPAPTLSSNSPICGPGILTLTAAPAIACGSSYTWSGPGGYSATTYNANNTVDPPAAGGTYSVSVSVNGVSSCPSSPGTATVTISPLPTLTATATPTAVCTNNTLALNATPAGGGGAFPTFAWSGPGGFTATTGTSSATNVGITAAGAGVYSVTVTDNNGCTSAVATTASVTVNPLPTITAVAMPNQVCSGATLTLNATPAGSDSYPSFTWSGPGGFTSTAQNAVNPNMSGAGVGVYSVSVTDNNGCTSASAGTTAPVALFASPSIAATAAPAVLCQGAALGLSAVATPGGGISFVSYAWAGPAGFTATGSSTSVADIPAGGGGVYSVTVTDNNGCTSPVGATATVTVNLLPTITATATPAALCANTTLTLNSTPVAGSGSSFTAFSWTGPVGSGFSAASQDTTNPGITAAGAGVYSVTVTDDNGCTSLVGATATVTVNPLPTVTATASPNPVCPNNTLSLSATGIGGGGAYPTFTWSGPGSFSASGSNVANPGMSASGVGVYSVSVTDNNGCTSAAAGTTDNVTLFTLPTITATAMPTSICAGNTLTLNATPTAGSGTSFVSYSWSGPPAFTASTQNTANTAITAAGAGVYTVTVIDNNNCTSLPGTTAAVTVNPLPAVSNFALPSATAPCLGFASTVNVGSTTLTPGAYTVTYNLTGADTATSHAASVMITASAGTFIVPSTDLTYSGASTLTVTSITDANGCNSAPSSGNTIVINVKPLPLAITGNGSVCVASTITLSDATTGGAGTWSSDNTVVATIGSSSGNVSGLFPGTATITYTIPTGCTITMTEIVNPNPNVDTVTGGGTFCTSVPNVHVGLTGSDLGASYQIYVGTTAIGGFITGTGSALDLGVQTAPGLYTVVANPTATCNRLMFGSATVVANHSANLQIVTGGGSACLGSGVLVGLSGSQAAVSYQLYNTLGTVGSPVTGDGSAFNFPAVTAADTYAVAALNTANLCLDTMTGSVTVTINPLPDSIFGSFNICSAASTTLTDGTSGGTWSATGFAGVGAFTGVVTGGLPGTATITYKLPTTCAATHVITVNPAPVPITGIPKVCSDGLTTLLTDGTTGGVWSSASTGNASVSPSGLVTSGVDGIAPITYTLDGLCATSVLVTVNLQPANVLGTTILCSGVPVTLSDSTTGGTWTSSNNTVASVAAASGLVSGYATGSAVIAYTLAGGCSSAATVNVFPSGQVLGLNNVCVNSAITLSDTSSGGTWSSGAPSIATMLPGSGSVTGVSGGLATITYSLPEGCRSLYQVTVNDLPALKNMTGGGVYCSGGTGVHLGLNGSVSGTNYQLFNGVAPVGSPLSGTGSALDFGSKTDAGAYTVVATNTATGCSVLMTGSETISINPLPGAFTMLGTGSYCSGGTGVDVRLSGSATGISYQLFDASLPIGPAVTGVGLLIDFGLQTATGAYGVVATNTTTGCTNIMTGITTVTVLPLPAAYTISGGGSYCAGTAGAHVFLSSSAAGTNYQLLDSGVATGAAVPGTGGPLDFGALPAGVYTATALNTITGCEGPMAGSATVTVNPLPASKNVTGGGAYCSGSSSTVHIGLNGSVSGTTYLLLLSGVPIGSLPGTGSPLDFGVESGAGIYTVVATTGAGCTAAMAGSDTIVVNPLPAMNTVTGGGSYCAGTTSAVHIGLNGSTVGVNYQLYNAGVSTGSAVAGTGVSLDFGAEPAGSYTVKANSTAGCISSMSGSASIIVNPSPGTFTVSATSASYCAGSAAPHILLSGSAPGAIYQLLLGSSIVSALSGTGGSLDFGPQVAGSPYSATAAIIATGCTATMTGSVTIALNPLPVSTYSVTGGGSYCAGGAGKTVGLSNSTSGIRYQLFVGGIAAGASVPGTGASISFGLQAAVGAYTAVATNTVTACSSNMAGGVSISTTTPPVVYNVTGGGSYCTGTATGVHVGLAASNVGVSYQLFISGTTAVGAPVAGIGGAIDFGLQTVVGAYTVVATNIATSCTSNMFGSAVVSIAPLPTVYNVSAGGSYCLGGPGYPVSLGSSTIGVNYQLMLGGVPVGSLLPGTGLPVNFGYQAAEGNYTVFATNATTGCGNNMSGASAITINPLPVVFNVTSAGASYCAGGTGVDIGLTGSDAGFYYQLYNAGVLTGDSLLGSGAALDFGNNTAGVYTVLATNSITSCTSMMAGAPLVITTIAPLTIYTVTGGGNYCAGSAGADVGLSNSTAGISYQLMAGSTPAGAAILGSGLPLDFDLQTAGSYTVVATNLITSCTQAMAGAATVNVISLPALHTVTGGGNYCAGSTGSDVSLNGSDIGVTYQLYNGLLPVGAAITGTGASIDFGPQTVAGTYSVVATNTASPCSVNMTGAVSVGISPLPTVYTVTGSGNYCPSAAGVHVILSHSDTGVKYQLWNGLATVGLPVAGTGSSLDFGPHTAGVYTVVAKNSTTSCTSNMSGSATITVSPLPVAYNLTGGGGYCQGASGLDISLAGSNTGNTYQLYVAGILTGPSFTGTGFAIDFGPQTAAGSYTVIAANTATTCTNTMTGAPAITINPLPDTFDVSGGGPYCATTGGAVVGLASSEGAIRYQLYNGIAAMGLPVTGTGVAITFGAQTAAGTYTVVGENPGTGCTNNMPGNAVITINPLPLPYPVTGGGNYCPLGAGVHVGLGGSSAGTSYQLYNGAAVGTPIAGTGSAIDFGLQTAPGNYTVVATNTATSCNTNMPGSVVVGISAPPVVYTLSGTARQYCAGGAGIGLSLSGSDAGASYQVYLGPTPAGVPVLGSGLPLNLGLQTSLGIYTVLAVNAAGCVSQMSGRDTVSITPLPSVFAVAGGGNYCPGGTGVHVGLTGSQSGINYQLYNGLTAVGDTVSGTGAVLDLGLQTVAGTYTVVANNAATGCISNMSGAATVGINAIPALYAVTGGGNYCAGGAGLPVGLSSSNAGVSYQLLNTGVAAGAPMPGTGALLAFGMQTAAGAYTVLATNTATGCTNTMAGSAPVIVNSAPSPYIVSGGGNYCAGGAGLHVGLLGSSGGINYQLYNGALPVDTAIAGTGVPIDFGLLFPGGAYTIVATNATTGCTSLMTGSAPIVVDPLPVAYTLTGGGNYCAGSAGVHIGLSNSDAGILYQLFNVTAATGLPVVGTGSGIDFGLQTALGGYTIVASNPATGCIATMTGATTVGITTPVVPSVSISTGTDDTVCAGTSVTIAASLLNGGLTPAYSWSVNGVPVASASGAYTYSPAVGDVVSLTITSSAACAAPATATSSPLSLHVLPHGMPSVSITSSIGDTVCQGTSVTFTPTIAYGGNAPALSWMVGASTVSAAATYSYAPVNGDEVHVVMTGNYLCPIIHSPVSSNVIDMDVNTSVTPIVTVLANPGTHVQPNEIITLTADIANVVISPSYQWALNGDPIPGATGASYTFASYNNLDSFSCLVTSGGGCAGLKGANSAVIHVSSLSVNQIASSGSDIRLVPNPNNGTFTIKGTLGASPIAAGDEEVSVEISDMLGQVIYQDKVMVRGGKLDQKIQLNGTIANGMYILTLRSSTANDVFHVIIEQ